MTLMLEWAWIWEEDSVDLEEEGAVGDSESTYRIFSIWDLADLGEQEEDLEGELVEDLEEGKEPILFPLEEEAEEEMDSDSKCE